MTLIYTSGTTGPPKGAMVTVGNVEYCIEKLVDGGGFYNPPPGPWDVTLSYLPLCHVAERIATSWINAQTGTQVHFAESIETVQANLKEVQPTLFFAVPRIWEKIHAGIQIRMYSASRLKRWNYRFWMKVADRIADELVAREGTHTWWTKALYWLGYPFLFRALRDRIGLRKCRSASSGAAPIAPEVLKFFFGLGIVIREVYGMTENTAVATVNYPDRVKLGTVGEPHPGIELKLDETTGEILTRHPATFAGYWNKPDKTAETIDADGWLHTADVGGRRHPHPHRRPHQGHHHHGRRQEHLAVRDRELAEDLAVHQGGGRRRRRAEVPHRPDRHRAGHGGGLGHPQAHPLHDLPGPGREARGARARPGHRPRDQRKVRPRRERPQVPDDPHSTTKTAG